MRAESLLFGLADVRDALGPRVQLEVARENGSSTGVGEVVRSAAADSAFRRFKGTVTLDGQSRPLAVSGLSLVFDTPAKAARTFEVVAEAAHLRTRLEGCSVAVETVTSPAGLVSYWGFLWLDEAIVIVTIDTVDPQQVSITDLRSLVMVAARRLEMAHNT